jgi:hypothetical protein
MEKSIALLVIMIIYLTVSCGGSYDGDPQGRKITPQAKGNSRAGDAPSAAAAAKKAAARDNKGEMNFDVSVAKFSKNSKDETAGHKSTIVHVNDSVITTRVKSLFAMMIFSRHSGSVPKLSKASFD